MHDAAKSSEHSTSSPIPNAEPLPSAPRDRGSRSLSIAALIFVAMAAVMGWGASFVGLHEYGMQSMAGFTYWSAWLVPATFDGAAFACTLMTYRSSINGRSAVRGRILMWAFTGVSSWINWIHQPSQEAQIVAAGLPIAAVAVFDVVLLELRADYEAKHGMRGFRLRPGLLVLRWMVDRRSTGEAFRKQVIDIPVEEIAGLGTLAPPGTRRANALKVAAQAEAEQQAASQSAAGAIGETERVEPASRAEVQPRVEAEPAARTESSTSDDERAENSRNAPRTTSNEASRTTEPAAQRPAAEHAAASSAQAGSTAAETAESGSTARDSATAATTSRAAAKTDAAATSSDVTTKSSGASATNSDASAKASGAVAADSAAEARESGTTAQDERSATTARNAQRPAEEARSELATGGTADAPTVTLELPKVTAEQDARAAASTAETGTPEADTPETDTSGTDTSETGTAKTGTAKTEAAAKPTAKSGAAKQKPAATTTGGAKKPTDVQDTEQTLTLPPVPDGPMSDQDKRSAARYDYRMSVAAEQPVKPAELAKRYGLSESWGRRQINAARKSMAQEEAHEKSQLVGADQS
ncbi:MULTISPECIES: DUF2637 domain-containing protein [unclassified Saccharopolyspora]|uniref:DUF2637 domain-containing protein n=1 Tax=unclassified Saccharopolyspora TaxID=2646250 RepID=UPI001CD76DF7|nr:MULTISPECIES: DUF2637 domain-containing protein [unclassified Saccharopolyspora]MCA1187699.1 DUF2637 domain-containing protein [Saccharopolyspora sp. 6T]MCA1227231.1 DUF2637 domain-containing protein [Saccharopolyspora sp. 6M]MCA1281148.1 DUF2637 domain-containing protein [Saccharopolyspora sp. 7B]